MSITRLLQQASGGSSGEEDPDFSDVSLLLDGDGTNGADNNTFTDSGYFNFGVTASSAGMIAQGSFSPYATSKPLNMTTDGGSGYFDNSYLTVNDSASFDIVNSNMTIEAWVYVTKMPTGNIGTSGQSYVVSRWLSSGSQRSWMIIYGQDGKIGFWLSRTGTSIYDKAESATGVITLNTWHHVAGTTDGTTNRLFVDGVEVGDANFNGVKADPSAPILVNAINNSSSISTSSSYVTDVRYQKNQAIYTSDFTPPTSPLNLINSNTALLLNFQDAGIYDLSGTCTVETKGAAQITTAVKKYGTGSIDLSGTANNSELQVLEQGGSLTFGTGDFTVETWLYLATSGGIKYFIDWRSATGNQGLRPTMYITNGRVYYYNGGTRISSSSISGRLNQWLHVALVRNSGDTKLYIDGTQEGATYADSSNYLGTQNGRLYIGGLNGSYELDGYLDDLRITKGIARYTGNFTPPTEALPKS